jgi:virulence factor Mce-like protein
MQRQTSSIGRLVVMVGFALSCFCLLLFLWVTFGGPVPLKSQGYRFHINFPEAGTLADEADVRISGVPVGKVRQLKHTTNGTDATIELERRYSPLPADARAILRQKTLLGETYVELTPGTKSGPKVPEDGTLRTANISPTVELDEIFRAFDDRTRVAFQRWMQSQAQASIGRGRDINDALGALGPFAESGADVLRILDTQRLAVSRLVRNTGDVFAALTERDGQLRQLIENSDLTFRATADRNRELAETMRVLPTFESESKLLVERLEGFAKRTDPLVTQLRPAARELSPTLTDLSALAPDLKALLRDLGPLIGASRTGFPAISRLLDKDLGPTLGQLDPFLRTLNPMLDFIGLYQNEIQAFFGNTAATTQATDLPINAKVPVHYLRLTNPINPENLAVWPSRLATNRANAYRLPDGFADFAKGLKVYDDRWCGTNGLPVANVAIAAVLPQAVRDALDRFVFGRGSATIGAVPAPPCVRQGPFTFDGRTSRYPHIQQRPPR